MTSYIYKLELMMLLLT